MTRSAAWFDRQLAHAREAIAEADKRHTPDELAAAAAALSAPRHCAQASLFSAAPHVGVMTGGQPVPDGLASAPSQAIRRTHANH